MRLFLALFIVVFVANTNIWSQEEEEFGPGVYMLQAFEDINSKLSVYLPNNDSNLGWRPELCLAGAVLDVGETIALDLFLEAGVEYVFIGGGDEDVTVLDAYLVSERQEVVASDIMDDRTPIVSYTPDVAGMYSLRLQLVGCDAAISFLGVAILQSGGGNYDESSFTEISSQLISSSENVHTITTGITYHSSQNQWSSFGFYLDPGEESTVENLNMGSDYGTQWIVSASQSTLSNTDLHLLDANYNEIMGDDAEDNYPLFSNENLGLDQNYAIRARAVSGSSPGLFVFSILSE
ncbi:MAG: hypothetical protein AAFO91_03225 [Bacteroidota bacterium]